MTDYRHRSSSSEDQVVQKVTKNRISSQGTHEPGVAAHYGYPLKSNKKEAERKKGSKLWRVVFWIALAVFVSSLLALGALAFSYFQGQNTYRSIAESAFTPPSDYEGTSLADMKVNWDALLEKNPDTVGWIYIPGTVVNYPIVHTTNNDKYLKTDFLGEGGWLTNFGTIFLSAENTPNFSDENNIVYGHHMNDGSMFACIDTMRDSREFNTHRTTYILTPQGNYRLTSFSLVICAADDPLARTRFIDAADFTSYIQDKIDRSVVAPDSVIPSAESMQKIFSLVTCDYTINDGRAVLFASVTESTVAADAQGQEKGGLINPDDVAHVGDATKELG